MITVKYPLLSPNVVTSYKFPEDGSINCDVDKMECQFDLRISNRENVAIVTGIDNLQISPSAVNYYEEFSRKEFEDTIDDGQHDIYLVNIADGKKQFWADVVENTLCEVQDNFMRCFYDES